MKSLSFFLTIWVWQSYAYADLQWEKKELEFHPSVTDTSVKAEFKFTNPGPGPVTIRSVEPACGCTTAVPDKMTYQPGEQGRITTVFTFGQRTGLQNKEIRVFIQGEEKARLLSIITHIPDLLKVVPQFVFWQTGDAPLPKTIELTVARETPILVTKVTSSDPTVKVALETVEAGKAYKLVVTPAQTSTPVSSLLSIETDIAPKVHQFFSAYAHIKQSGATRPKIWVYKDGETKPTVLER